MHQPSIYIDLLLRPTAFVALVAGLALGCPQQPEPARSPANADEQSPVSAPSALLETPCPIITRIDVWKSSHRLLATCGDGGAFDLTVAIGRGDLAAKAEFGDGQTPEGHYAVAGPARASRFHLFIPIDYPSVRDADRGLAGGLIDAATHARILDAHALGRLPPQETVLGGAIGLHGEGERWQGESRHSDWTLGCIAVSDIEIERLADRVGVGVPVVIHP